MKLEIYQIGDINGLIKNGMDFNAYYIPKEEAARVEKILQCLYAAANWINIKPTNAPRDQD